MRGQLGSEFVTRRAVEGSLGSVTRSTCRGETEIFTLPLRCKSVLIEFTSKRHEGRVLSLRLILSHDTLSSLILGW
jgi:hypothetical protein